MRHKTLLKEQDLGGESRRIHTSVLQGPRNSNCGWCPADMNKCSAILETGAAGKAGASATNFQYISLTCQEGKNRAYQARRAQLRRVTHAQASLLDGGLV